MASKRCPQCNLVNPASAERCDCGFSFSDGTMGASLNARLGGPTHHVDATPRTSGMAVAGFVLSFFCALLGLIFAILGYNECKASNGIVKGQTLALAGILISIFNILLGILWYAIVRSKSG